MARYRLSGPAKADIASILRTSELRFGAEARKRYSTLLVASPVHVIFFRTVGPDELEGLRVLHEPMDLAANMAPHTDRRRCNQGGAVNGAYQACP